MDDLYFDISDLMAEDFSGNSITNADGKLVPDAGTDGFLILPGFWPDAIGWYLCERLWRDDALVVAEIE